MTLIQSQVNPVYPGRWGFPTRLTAGQKCPPYRFVAKYTVQHNVTCSLPGTRLPVCFRKLKLQKSYDIQAQFTQKPFSFRSRHYPLTFQSYLDQ
jgi:hypothetical protein